MRHKPGTMKILSRACGAACASRRGGTTLPLRPPKTVVSDHLDEMGNEAPKPPENRPRRGGSLARGCHERRRER